MQRVYEVMTILSLFFGISACSPASDSKSTGLKWQTPVFPDQEWEFITPQEAGLDVSLLDSLKYYLAGRGCVVRNGYMVYTWGEQEKRTDVASASKPVLTHLLFLALERRKIKNLDEPVSAYEPRLTGLNPELGYKDRKITWRHLANMISCYGVSEQPGTAFDYNDYNIALLRDLLIKKVYRSSYERMDQEVLHPAITDLLDCQDNPTLLAFGIENRPGRLAVSVRDFARFGLLYLRDGNWQGRQLISREHVDTILGSPLPASLPRTRNVPAQMIEGQKTHGGGSNQAPHDGSYSFLWWVNGVDFEGRRHWPEAPEDTYMASGHWGPRTLVVIPSLKLVVSWNDAFPEHWDWKEATMIGLEMTKKALGILVRAVNE